jgi:hypothetical protein
MDIDLLTYGSHNINDGTAFVSKIVDMPPLQRVSESMTRRTNYAPDYGGKTYNGGEFEISIDMKGTAVSQIETLAQWFDVEAGLDELVIQDTNNANKQWKINATTHEMKRWLNNSVLVKMLAPDPVWKSVTQYSGTITVAGTTTASGTITVGGNKETYPTIEITPTSYPTGGFGYRQYVLFYNRSTKPMVNYPVNIAGTTGYWATNSLVGAGKLQSDLDDLRVLVNGQPVNYWTNGGNSATTSVWINLTAREKISFLTEVAISNAGTPATITVKNTVADKAAAAKMPTRGIILIDNEEFSYNGHYEIQRRRLIR